MNVDPKKGLKVSVLNMSPSCVAPCVVKIVDFYRLSKRGCVSIEGEMRGGMAIFIIIISYSHGGSMLVPRV